MISTMTAASTASQVNVPARAPEGAKADTQAPQIADTFQSQEPKPKNESLQGDLKGLFFDITAQRNVPGSPVVRRDGITIDYVPRQGETLQSALGSFTAGLEGDPANSSLARYALDVAVHSFAACSGSCPVMVALEHIVVTDGQGGRKLLEYKAPHFTDAMTWDCWHVQERDGSDGIDYINRNDKTLRLFGEGTPTRRWF